MGASAAPRGGGGQELGLIALRRAGLGGGRARDPAHPAGVLCHPDLGAQPLGDAGQVGDDPDEAPVAGKPLDPRQGLIGVITHLPGVAERLGAEIRVAKDAGGVSRVARGAGGEAPEAGASADPQPELLASSAARSG